MSGFSELTLISTTLDEPSKIKFMDSLLFSIFDGQYSIIDSFLIDTFGYDVYLELEDKDFPIFNYISINPQSTNFITLRLPENKTGLKQLDYLLAEFCTYLHNNYPEMDYKLEGKIEGDLKPYLKYLYARVYLHSLNSKVFRFNPVELKVEENIKIRDLKKLSSIILNNISEDFKEEYNSLYLEVYRSTEDSNLATLFIGMSPKVHKNPVCINRISFSTTW